MYVPFCKSLPLFLNKDLRRQRSRARGGSQAKFDMPVGAIYKRGAIVQVATFDTVESGLSKSKCWL